MKEKNLKKIFIEMFVIMIALGIFVFALCNQFPRAVNILLFGCVLITCFEIMISYIRKLYVPKQKNKYLYIFSICYFVLFMFITFCMIFKPNSLFNILFLIGVFILLIFILYIVYFNMKFIIKNKKKKIYSNAMKAYFSLMGFIVIIVTLLLYLV